MPRIVLNAENTKENKRDSFPSPQRAYTQRLGRTDNKQTSKPIIYKAERNIRQAVQIKNGMRERGSYFRQGFVKGDI